MTIQPSRVRGLVERCARTSLLTAGLSILPPFDAQAVEPETPPSAEDHAPVEPPPLALELLPPEAYPNHPTPGIPGGSLSLMIHRLQWPYMPKSAGEPPLRVGFSGFGWLDSSYRTTEPGKRLDYPTTEYRMQGRFGLRATPVYNVHDDYFIQANVEFIANTDQTPVTGYTDIDDAWIRVGKWKMFDVQVGRMQGFEVYHFGMGLDLNTFERLGAYSTQFPQVAQAYGLTDLWDRGISTGGAAIHWYYPEWLRLELLARFGITSSGNDVGLRPVGVLDFDWVKLKAGYERRLRSALEDQSDARTETQGVGAELQFVLSPWVELGGGVGHRVEDDFEPDGAPRPGTSTTTLTYGGFLNARPYFEDWLVGVGYHRTYWENFNFDARGNPENQTHQQMFAAVQYLLWDELYIKYVLGYAKADVELRADNVADSAFANEALSHRLRLMVLY